MNVGMALNMNMAITEDVFGVTKEKMADKKYQFINWFPIWEGLAFIRLDPEETDLAYIYDWCLIIGFFEIRKWSTKKINESKKGD